MAKRRYNTSSHAREDGLGDAPEDGGEHALAQAICVTAANDYRAARSALSFKSDDELALRVYDECRHFFLSWYFVLLSGSSGEYVLRKLDEEPINPRYTPERIRFLSSHYPARKGEKMPDAEKRLTAEEKAALEKMRVESESIRSRIAAGETFKSIGESYGLSATKTARFARENNLVYDKKADAGSDLASEKLSEPAEMSEETRINLDLLSHINTIRLQLRKDKPIKEIADMYGVEYPVMKKFIASYKLNEE